jgi:SDR family mycofactocin-dependent oxidoreductase
MPGRVEGQVAFITGAARGQGRSHALRLAEEGADIIGIDACVTIPERGYQGPTEEDLAESGRLVEKHGRRAVMRKADVRDLAALQAAVAEGVEELGRLDIISANAGIGTKHGKSHEMSEQEWQLMLDINLTGVWHTCKAGVPHILAGGRGGSVVLTGSTASIRGHANIGNYVAAKHGLLGLMKTMAIELGPHQIRVNAILPTQVATPMIMNEKAFRLFRPDLDEPTIDDFAAASQATGILPIPWLEPVDVSNALLFLASNEARCITGAALPVDNGNLLK